MGIGSPVPPTLLLILLTPVLAQPAVAQAPNPSQGPGHLATPGAHDPGAPRGEGVDARSVPGPVDPAAAAERVVVEGARVRAGERVWIKVDGTADPAFVDALMVAVGRAGGHPVVTLLSDAMLRGWYGEVPLEVDARPDPWLGAMYGTADVLIEIDGLDYAVFGQVPEERFVAWDAANGGLEELARERGMRVVRFGNTLLPNAARAAILGVSETELAQAFWEGVMAEPGELARTGARLREVLEGARALRVTDPNGTDLRLVVATRTVVVTDGTTAPVESHRPDAGLNITWIPGGEVTLGIDPSSVEGRLVVERTHWDGEELRELTLEFTGGRLLDLRANPDPSRLRTTLEMAPPLSGSITGLKIGINPAMDDWRLLPFMGRGVVSLGLGSNRLLGGEVDLPFLLFLSLRNATLEVDGVPLVREGALLP
jgi:leucyl aminopeptidase (aminopeptidase T)